MVRKYTRNKILPDGKKVNELSVEGEPERTKNRTLAIKAGLEKDLRASKELAKKSEFWKEKLEALLAHERKRRGV